jgi:hypothetical protein
MSFFIVTLLSHFWMLIAQSFFIAIVLIYFSLLRCSAIPPIKGAQSFFDATLLSYFLLLQWSVIFYCYSTRPFRCYSTHSLLVITAREASQSFCKMTELDHGRVGSSRAGSRVVRDQAAWGAGRARAGSVDRSVGWVQVIDHVITDLIIFFESSPCLDIKGGVETPSQGRSTTVTQLSRTIKNTWRRTIILWDV